MPFVIGYVPSIAAGSIKRVSHSRDTRDLREGDVVEVLDHILQWDNHCVTEETCETWRSQDDTLCDAALQQIFSSSSSSVGHDLLASLESFVASHPEPGPARDFLEYVSQVPPEEIAIRQDQVRIAQNFFLDNGIQIMQALLHYSLAGGFASPRIVRTLHAVSYLVPHSSSKGSPNPTPTSSSNDRTFARLLETMQFILDIFGCTYPLSSEHLSVEYLMPGKEGWRSAVRVRMLHGVARWRVRERWKKEGKTVHEEESTNGIPINQEDLGGTLTSFSTIPIWCLHRLHLPPSQVEVEAYLALWRHIGFYLGIDPSILKRYFTDPRIADKFLASTALHLFSDVDADSEPRTAPPPTIPILLAASNRPPQRTSFEFNCALTRHLLGPTLSQRLGVPPTSLRTYIEMHTTLLIQRIPNMFARWYPRGAWREKRRRVLREGMARSLRWSLGQRKVGYRPRTDIVRSAHGTDEGGELGDGVNDAELVKTDPEGAQRLVKEWKEVLFEMVGVCGTLAIGAVAAGSWVALRWVHFA